MGIKMTYKDSDKLNVIADDILKDIELTEEEALEAMKPKLQVITVEELRRIKRIKNIMKHRRRANGEKRRNRHMYQDVEVKIDKDDYGYKVLKVRGRAQTGTLWHIVNDGTYRTRATHFMDKIIERAGKELDALVSRELEKRGEK